MTSHCEYCGDELTCSQCAPNEYVQHLQTNYEALVRRVNSGGCTLAGPGRGDCENTVGLPGKSIPGQHDGDDDTVDVHGKPNGWCWSCWKSYRIRELEKQLAQAERGAGMNWKR